MRPVVLSFSRYLDPFQFFPPLSSFLYKCSLLLCLNVTVLSMLVKALLSSFHMSRSYGEWLSAMMGCLTTMFAQTFCSLYTKLWITFNKASSLHEIWAARLWPWRVQSKQCFSTTDSTPHVQHWWLRPLMQSFAVNEIHGLFFMKQE